MKNQIFAACLAAAALLGCSSPPRVDPTGSVTLATGVGEPFVYQTDGESIDIDADQQSSLTCEQAIRKTLRHSPAIQQSIARVRIAQAEAGQARLLPNPILSLSLRFPENGTAVIDAGITAELLSLIKRPGQISAADHRLRASIAELLTVVLDELAAVENQYALVQTHDAELEVLRARKVLVDQLSELARSRQQAGEGSQLDVLSTESEVASLQSEIAEKNTLSRTARLGLARQIGQPGSESRWKLEQWNAPVVKEQPEAEWISLGLQNRPEIQGIIWELNALGDEVAMTKLSSFDGSQAGVNAERDGGWSVGPAVSVGIPVFDLGQERRAVADAKRIEARHQFTQIRRHVVEQVRVALEELRSNQITLASVHQTLLPIQEKRLTQAQSTYRSGLTDITAVRLAEQELQRTRSRIIDLELRVTQARIKLDRAVGGRGITTTSNTSTTQSSQSEVQQ